MSHLLAISVGPVQEFIAAARRTRDLWFGSYLLSQISRAVAMSVETHGQLIFPADLSRHGDQSEEDSNIANVILAKVNGERPDEVARGAKNTAESAWRSIADSVRENLSQYMDGDRWTDQKDEVIEFFAAWTLHTKEEEYGADRARVMRLLAGRKSLRNFSQAYLRDDGCPKSSLDGRRDSVLRQPPRGGSTAQFRSRWPQAISRSLSLSAGEQLDVVGVVKRCGEGIRKYPSVERIAADPWIRGVLSKGGREELRQLAELCAKHPDLFHKLDVSRFPQYEAFRFDGTAMFRIRHHEWWEETGDAPERTDSDRKQPSWFADFDRALRPVEAVAAGNGLDGAPSPYLAVLVADGDRVGQAISHLTSMQGHQNFSRALAHFACGAGKIVAKNQGIVVYAGGDDVLAFVPVDSCLKCARDLHSAFQKEVDIEELGNVTRPTLSVGIAIGHLMENLEDLLQHGREAEKAAKNPDRNGLAVHLHKRGGAPVRFRARWNEDPDKRIESFARLMLARAIPGKLAYDLRQAARAYRGWKADTPAEKTILTQAIRKDVLRIIQAKQPRAGRSRMHEVEAALSKRIDSERDRPFDAEALLDFSNELLIARMISDSMRQAGGASEESALGKGAAS